MQKAIIPALAATTLMFVLMGLGGSKQTPVPAEPIKPVTAVVRIQDIYEMSKIGKEAVQHLEKTQETAIAKLTDMQAQMEKARESKDEAQEQSLQVELQAFVYTMQDILNQEQERMVKMVTEKVNEGIERYRKDNGLQIILSDEYVQSFGPEMDVTDKAIAVIDTIAFEIGEIPAMDASVPAMILPEGQAEPQPEDAQPETPAAN